MSQEKLDLGYAPTATQYREWVADHGRLPTQDPIYNHSHHPVNRLSVNQEHKFRESLSLSEGLSMEAAQKVLELRQKSVQ